MPAKLATQNQMATVLREIRGIKAQLDKLLLLVPEESLNEYENGAQIRKAYARATKTAPPVEKSEPRLLRSDQPS